MFLSIAAASAVLFAPPVVTNPAWLQVPGPSEFEEVYPRQAWRDDVEGKVLIQCQVGVDTTLKNCRIVSETPEDYGFGAAAMVMSRSFRVSPRKVDGKPVDGAEIRVPITFKIPEADYGIPTFDEALRCYVGLTDGKTDAPEPLRTREMSYLWLLIQAYGLEQKLDAVALAARVKATREAMTRGEINADWCA